MILPFLLVPVVAANVAFAPCPSPTVQRSCYEPATKTIYLASVDRTNPFLQRSVLAHELGHAYADLLVPKMRYSEKFANDYEDCALGFRTRENRAFCRWLWERAPFRLLQGRIHP